MDDDVLSHGRGGVLVQLGSLFVFLLSSILSAAVRSLALVSFFHKATAQEKKEVNGGFALYKGRVWHQRRHPVLHSFHYDDVRYALIDLDKVPCWFHEEHHLNADEARGIAGTHGSVCLLTVPSSLDYEQNPLSVYYCYEDDELVKCIAEVTNTPWAERTTFVFEAGFDMVAKPLHVSPFMDMHGTWRMQTRSPNEDLEIVINVDHPQFGEYFTASFTGKRVEDCVVSPERFFWLMPHKIAFWIYVQAAMLLWKGVSFISHPKYEGGTEYRICAKQRDAQLAEEYKLRRKERYFAWREAPSWPWK